MIGTFWWLCGSLDFCRWWLWWAEIGDFWRGLHLCQPLKIDRKLTILTRGLKCQEVTLRPQTGAGVHCLVNGRQLHRSTPKLFVCRTWQLWKTQLHQLLTAFLTVWQLSHWLHLLLQITVHLLRATANITLLQVQLYLNLRWKLFHAFYTTFGLIKMSFIFTLISSRSIHKSLERCDVERHQWRQNVQNVLGTKIAMHLLCALFKLCENESASYMVQL